MGAVVPISKVGKIEFYENHIAPWTTNAVAIGTTAGEVSSLDTKTQAARDAFNAQQAAHQAAKAATEAFNNAVEAMAVAGSAIISQVRSKALTAGDNVYVLAQIPAPATPQPVNTLGLCGNFKAELDGNGALILTWKCVSPRASGTVYQVFRRTTAAGEFTYLGGSGQKKFVDETIPAGASQVTYQVQAVRSTAVGPWAQFNVNFGTGSGGAMTASVTETAAPKMAA